MTERATTPGSAVPAGGALDRLRFVLVETSHPGNIGAAARALKTMGFGELVLVSPRHFPSAEATVRASGADDILQRALVFDSLAEAIADCSAVFGTSARSRSIEWPTHTPWALAAEIAERPAESAAGPVAVVFGRESSGLTNDELMLCSARVHIPANPDYSSLNVASAVQILAYEIASHSARHGGTTAPTSDADPRADQDDMNRFYRHLESVLVEIGYYDPEKPRQLMRRLRRLFNRSALSRSELQILRGVLVAVERAKRA
ncbi:MAG: RNA methyltransferase [Pseudomonadota bacterium]